MFVFSILSCLFIQSCGRQLGKGCPLGSLVCDVFLCFCHFPIRCPGSGEVLDLAQTKLFVKADTCIIFILQIFVFDKRDISMFLVYSSK